MLKKNSKIIFNLNYNQNKFRRFEGRSSIYVVVFMIYFSHFNIQMRKFNKGTDKNIRIFLFRMLIGSNGA